MRKNKHYKAAVVGDPIGAVCFFCGILNDNWDENGFFYLWTDASKEFSFEDGKAACKACCAGEPGQIHERIHGKGNGQR